MSLRREPGIYGEEQLYFENEKVLKRVKSQRRQNSGAENQGRCMWAYLIISDGCQTDPELALACSDYYRRRYNIYWEAG